MTGTGENQHILESSICCQASISCTLLASINLNITIKEGKGTERWMDGLHSKMITQSIKTLQRQVKNCYNNKVVNSYNMHITLVICNIWHYLLHQCRLDFLYAYATKHQL